MSTASAPVNPLIGDISFFSRFEGNPNVLEENTRVQTHLSYVENYLRQQPVDHLTESQKVNRSKVLDALKSYSARKQFPKHDGNHQFATSRRPRFIDHNDTFCAVGHIIRETEGEQLARKINERYEYAYVAEMDYPPLLEWASRNGLSVEECARIQPQYFNWTEDCPFLNTLKDTKLESKLPVLRDYRDNHLRKSLSGRALIRFYYVTVPVTGFLTRKSAICRSLVMAFLKPTLRRIEQSEK